jgi:hypothetical protein
MPALSPTMTEGNIASWKFKEGDSFSAGDVLLEIETDKASMDVEAQDDGILAKIIQGDGSKGLKVGTRIGVLAEPGDDLSTLEIPADAGPAAAPPAPKEESKAAPEPASSSKAEASKPSSPVPSGTPKKQTYPLLPSVQHLIHEHGLDESAIDKMTPTGPNNRLLKGDVLAYLGSISTSYPAELSSRIEKLSHLDLSNIKIAPPAPKPAKAAPPPAAAAATAPIIEDLEVAVPISLTAVIEVQKRIQSTLGVFLPLSTFISRATALANSNLPRSKTSPPSADELFNQVLGLDKATPAKGFKGNFLPQISALPARSSSPDPTKKASTAPAKKKRDLDIIDILSGTSKTQQARAAAAPKPLPGISDSVNVFSVKVPRGDEKRAQLFLDRVKTALEAEPGRLVL